MWKLLLHNAWSSDILFGRSFKNVMDNDVGPPFVFALMFHTSGHREMFWELIFARLERWSGILRGHWFVSLVSYRCSKFSVALLSSFFTLFFSRSMIYRPWRYKNSPWCPHEDFEEILIPIFFNICVFFMFRPFNACLVPYLKITWEIHACGWLVNR